MKITSANSTEEHVVQQALSWLPNIAKEVVGKFSFATTVKWGPQTTLLCKLPIQQVASFCGNVKQSLFCQGNTNSYGTTKIMEEAFAPKCSTLGADTYNGFLALFKLATGSSSDPSLISTKSTFACAPEITPAVKLARQIYHLYDKYTPQLAFDGFHSAKERIDAIFMRAAYDCNEEAIFAKTALSIGVSSAGIIGATIFGIKGVQNLCKGNGKRATLQLITSAGLALLATRELWALSLEANTWRSIEYDLQKDECIIP